MRETQTKQRSANPARRARPLSTFVDLLGVGLSRVAFRGKGRFVGLLGRILVRACPEAHCWITRDQSLGVRLADRIERWMWAGCYERDLVTILRHSLRPGMVFVDVGAHIGYFTVLAWDLVRPAGRVHAFEADPHCFQRLLENSRALGGVVAHPVAVSDRVGEATFFASPDPAESGWGSLFSDGLHRPTRRVATTTLDEWWQREALERVDFVKMDVEGAEVRVLRGARGVLTRMRPLLFGEINPACLARDGETPDGLTKLLENYGYVVAEVFSGRDAVPGSFFAAPRENAGEIDRASRNVLRVRRCLRAS